MLYENGIDRLTAMMIVGHTDYQTTVSIYTHIKQEMRKKPAFDLEGVFKKRTVGRNETAQRSSARSDS